MKITNGMTYSFNHKEGTVLEKYDGTKCKVICQDKSNVDMFMVEMIDGRIIQAYENELSK